MAAPKAAQVQRAIRAAMAAGFEFDEVRVVPETGEVVLRRRGLASDVTPAEVDEEIAAWAADHDQA